MFKRLTLVVLFATILFFQNFSFAEVLRLKSGQEIEGRVIEKTDKYIKINFENVPLVYYLDEIISIDGKPASALKDVSSVSPAIAIKEAQDIFKDISPAIVYITTRTVLEEQYLGSGFIVDPSGVIVTNFHVVESAKEINVKLKDGTLYPVSAIIYYDINRDICLLKIDANSLPYLPLGNSEELSIGAKIYCVGNPLGLEYSFSDGMISGVRDLGGIKYLQFTAPISPGNSGGPIVDAAGRAIGIVTFLMERGQNLNFALAINEIKPFISTSPKLSLAEFIKNVEEGNENLAEEDSVISQDPSDKLLGTYEITESLIPSNKTKYHGTVSIAKKKDAYRLIWKFSDSPLYNRGVGIVVDNILCVGWGTGRHCGVVVYKVEGGRLKGKWSDTKSFLLGIEDLEGPAGLNGEYKIVNSSGYSGTVSINKKGKVYIVIWTLPQATYGGIGILQNDLLIVGWGAEPNVGVIAYKITERGLLGHWAALSDTGMGIENLSKIK